MFRHLRAVLLATAVLAGSGTMHTHSMAIARPTAMQAAPRTRPAPLASTLASSLVGASMQSVAIGF